MKKLTFVFVMLLMTFLATNNILAQEAGDYLSLLEGGWEFKNADFVSFATKKKLTPVQIDKAVKDVETKYAMAHTNFDLTDKTFSFSQSKTTRGKLSFEGKEVVIMTAEDGKVLFKGKVIFSDMNSDGVFKGMSIINNEQGVNMSINFVKQ